MVQPNVGVTLQINLAPSDWLHAKHILPHQLRQFSEQVDEIILTLDLHRSAGRFSEGWEERLPKIQKLIEDCCAQYSHAQMKVVDYSLESVSEVGTAFFGGRSIPPKDFRGGPFYSYFFGLHAANNDYVLHLDSDLMFGGGSQTWISEAVDLLAERPEVLTCGPLPGPPTSDGSLQSQAASVELNKESIAFGFPFLSTRYFLLDKRCFASRVGALSLAYPSPRNIIKALVEGNPPYRLPEEILTEAMQEHSLVRVEFLGELPGMWSLHPPYRTQEFYDKLPNIIQKIESGYIPDGQRGCHDINDSLVNWHSAKLALSRNRWWKRLARKISYKFRIGCIS